MKLRISRKYIVDYIIWFLLAFYVFGAHWIWDGRGLQESILILLSLLVICKNNFLKKLVIENIFDIFILFLLLYICMHGILSGNGRAYLVNDLKSMLGTFFVAIYFTSCADKPQWLKRIKNLSLKWLNIYTLINSVIIIIQYFVPYFMMNRGAINSVRNTTYFDQIVGFFGVNGTTRWCIWTVVLILFNFHIFFEKRNNKFLLYNIGLILMNIFIAMMNNARSFFIVLPMTLLIYFFIIRKVKFNVKMSYVMWVIGVVFIFFIIYLSNRHVRLFMDNLIDDKFAMYLSGDIKLMIKGNDDRTIAVSYAVQKGDMFGTGIGSIPMHSTNSVVKYLGLNSASSYIHMIGVVGYFLYSFVLARLGACMCTGKKQNRILLTAIYTIYLVIMSYLLPIYSSLAMLPGIIFIFMIFSLEQDIVIHKE